jgi:hypothetical protein
MADLVIPPLHDVALPPPISPWPPAPAASTMLILLAMVALWLLLRRYQCYRQNAYRRQALRQLDRLQASCRQHPEQLQQLPRLLRRTALQIWPREHVASLHGDAWLQRLEQQSDRPLPAELGALAYWPTERCTSLSEQARVLLFEHSRYWIQHHVRP